MAGEIPYPQAPEGPRFTESNPLEMMSQMQGLAQRNQAMQQQQQIFAAKQAAGEILQHHLDPETGDPDWHGAMAHWSADPRVAMIMPDLIKTGLENREIEAKTQLAANEAQSKRLENAGLVAMGVYSKIADKMQKTGATELSLEEQKEMAAGWVVEQGMAGLLNANQKGQALINLNARIKNGENITDILRQGIQSSRVGNEMLEKNNMLIKNYLEPTTVIDPRTGATISPPAYQVEGRVPQIMRNQFSNAAQGGSAPPAADVAGQEPQPSGAPATSRMYAPITARAPEEAEFEKQTYADYAEHRKEIAEKATQAEASQAQFTDLRKKIDIVGDRLGTTAPVQLEAAKLALATGDPLGAARKVTGTKTLDEAKNVIGAMEAIDKGFTLSNVISAQQAVGGRVTQGEFNKFQQSLATLRTTKDGLVKITDYMEKLNRLAIEHRRFLQQYHQEHRGKDYNRVNTENEWNNFLEKHPSMYKFEGSISEGK